VATASVLFMTKAAEQALGALAAAVDALLDVEWWRCSEADLRDAALAFEAQAARLAAAEARSLAEAESRAVHQGPGAVSTAAWLADAANTGPQVAGAQVRLAKALAGEAGRHRSRPRRGRDHGGPHGGHPPGDGRPGTGGDG
jgi:surface antigen